MGQGSIKVGGTSLDDQEQYASLNRDVNQGQITTLDQQTAGLNASVSVDHKMVMDAGKAVAEGVVAVAEGVKTVVHAYTKDLPPDMVETFGPEAKSLYRKMLLGGLSSEEEQQLDDFINTATELKGGKRSAWIDIEIPGAEKPSPEQIAAQREFKFQAVEALGDAGYLLKELPMDQVETGFKLVSLVTGGPVKYAISEGVNAVIGDSVDYLHGQVAQGIADWSQSYVGFDKATTERQVVGAGLGMALVGAATGLIPTGRGSLSSGVTNHSASGDARKAPDYVVAPNGTVFPVPKDAQGPISVINPAGTQTGTAYTGGGGGANGQVDTIRIMDPTPPKGSSPGYPNGYIKYENKNGQGVDPYTGRTIPNTQSHFSLE